MITATLHAWPNTCSVVRAVNQVFLSIRQAASDLELSVALLPAKAVAYRGGGRGWEQGEWSLAIAE